jgi:hypothetical protein
MIPFEVGMTLEKALAAGRALRKFLAEDRTRRRSGIWRCSSRG